MGDQTVQHATHPAVATSSEACPAPLARLREIRQLVHANNRSCLPDELIVCQIYMESRFDRCAQSAGSSARGLMQLLKVANRELFRLDNLCKPIGERCAEPSLYAAADAFHASPAFIDEATNIQMGTRYLQALIDKARREKRQDPIAEAYMDYRGVRNGVYYRKIRGAADRIRRDPDDIDALRAMTG